MTKGVSFARGVKLGATEAGFGDKTKIYSADIFYV